MKGAARETKLAVQDLKRKFARTKANESSFARKSSKSLTRINFLLGRFPQPVERPVVNYLDLNLYAINLGVSSRNPRQSQS